VPEAALVTALLRPIRRRLRIWSALEGAIAGGAFALVATAIAVALHHRRGEAVGIGAPLAVVLAGAATGALGRGLRRITLARCARFADAALDGQDRVLSALSLGAAAAATPLGRALAADAAARLAALAPKRAVPARRPKGALALAAGALAAVAAGVLPVRGRAVAFVRPAPAAHRGRPIPASALDAERDAAAGAAVAAQRLRDDRLAALAGDFERTLQGLQSGTLADGDALEALKAIEARAREAAGAAERERRAFEAAERGLASEAATRKAAAALGSSDGDGEAERRARAALGAEAEARPADTARALSAAARGVAGALGTPGDASEEQGPRRLAREGHDGNDGNDGAGQSRTPPDAKAERKLERLRRDLDDAAGACRDGAAGCRGQAEDRAGDLAQLARSAAGAESLQRLERATRQARQRLEQGELRGGGSAERRFQSAARGEGERGGEEAPARAGRGGDPASATGESGDRGPGGKSTPGQPQEGQDGQDEGDGVGIGMGQSQGKGNGAAPGQGQRQQDGDGTESAVGAEARADGRGEATGGDGIGHEPGGAPLGRKSDLASRGQDAEARVADGAGPSRAQVIGVAAGRGFASPGYARVFSDYQAAMEDALGATAVPEGKRYLVRRYFDLIRPRTGRHRP
jgi:hypothetical protein